MRRSSAVGSAVALTAAVALVLSGCTQRSNQDVPAGADGAAPTAAEYPETPDQPRVPGRPGGTFRLGIVEPTAIDPYNAQESEGILVTKALFTGLVDVTAERRALRRRRVGSGPPNADCTQWTFTLKPGTTFSNGEPVDSAAVQARLGAHRGRRRPPPTSPTTSTRSRASTQMQDGSATTLSGVDATDPNTLARHALDAGLRVRPAHRAPASEPGADGRRPGGQQGLQRPADRQRPVHDGRAVASTTQGIRLVRNDTYGGGTEGQPRRRRDHHHARPRRRARPSTTASTTASSTGPASRPRCCRRRARRTSRRASGSRRRHHGINYLQAQTRRTAARQRRRAQGDLDGDRPRRDHAGRLPGLPDPGHRVRPAVVPAPTRTGVCDGLHLRPRQGQGARRRGRPDRRHAGELPVQHRRRPRGVDGRGEAAAGAEPRARRRLQRRPVPGPAREPAAADRDRPVPGRRGAPTTRPRATSSPRCWPPPRSGRRRRTTSRPATTAAATATRRSTT